MVVEAVLYLSCMCTVVVTIHDHMEIAGLSAFEKVEIEAYELGPHFNLVRRGVSPQYIES